MFKIGDTVTLSDEGFDYWVIGYGDEEDENNPRNTTGEVFSLYDPSDSFNFFDVRVMWSNGKTNSYRNVDLNKVTENV